MTTYYVVVGFKNSEDFAEFIPYANSRGPVPGEAITFSEEQAETWATSWERTFNRKYIVVSVDESEL